MWAGCCESEVGLGTCNTVVGPPQTTCSWCEVLMNLTRDKFNSAVKTEDCTFLASGKAKFGARDWVSPSFRLTISRSGYRFCSYFKHIDLFL